MGFTGFWWIMIIIWIMTDQNLSKCGHLSSPAVLLQWPTRSLLGWRRWIASSSQHAWSTRTTSSTAMPSLSPSPLGWPRKRCGCQISFPFYGLKCLWLIQFFSKKNCHVLFLWLQICDANVYLQRSRVRILPSTKPGHKKSMLLHGSIVDGSVAKA